MIRTILSIALLVAAPAFAAEIELKGFKPGMSIADVRALYPTLRCDEGDENRYGECVYQPGTARLIHQSIDQLDTVAGEGAQHWQIMFAPSGKLARARVITDPSSFDALEVALKEKFGKPLTAKVKSLQNAFGAKFAGREVLWSMGDDFVLLREMDGSRDRLSVSVGRLQLLDQVNKHVEKAAKKKAKDL
jgi:hypothetical protein